MNSGTDLSLTANSGMAPDRANRLRTFASSGWRTCWRQASWTLRAQVVTEVVFGADECRQPWASARLAAEGSYTGYLGDLDLLWRNAEDRKDLGLGIRCALLAASVRSLSGNLFPGLLVALVTVGTPAGRWGMPAALGHVRHIPDSHQRCQALEALLESGCPVSPDLAMDLALSFPEDGYRARALKRVAPLLPESLLPQALATARTLAGEDARFEALLALAGRLPPTQQAPAYADALAAAGAIKVGWNRTQALKELLTDLPECLLPAALACVRATPDDADRAVLLVECAPRLALVPQADIDAEALQAARGLPRVRRKPKFSCARTPTAPGRAGTGLLRGFGGRPRNRAGWDQILRPGPTGIATPPHPARRGLCRGAGRRPRRG